MAGFVEFIKSAQLQNPLTRRFGRESAIELLALK